MNRRSVLRWLGLAPVAAPAAIVAASAPDLPPIDYSGLADSVSRQIAVVNARMMASEHNIRALSDPVMAEVRDSISRIEQAEARIISERSSRATGPIDVCHSGLLTTRLG